MSLGLAQAADAVSSRQARMVAPLQLKVIKRHQRSSYPVQSSTSSGCCSNELGKLNAKDVQTNNGPCILILTGSHMEEMCQVDPACMSLLWEGKI